MEQAEALQEKMRAIERENSELKAAKLMTMFSNPPSSSQPRVNTQVTTERQIETLRVQLSEKTNEYLKLKDENERLREQLESREEVVIVSPPVEPVLAE